MKIFPVVACSLCFGFARLANAQEIEASAPPRPARAENHPPRQNPANRAPRIAPAPRPVAAPNAAPVVRQNVLPGQQFHRYSAPPNSPDDAAMPSGVRRFDPSMSVVDREAIERRRRSWTPAAPAIAQSNTPTGGNAESPGGYDRRLDWRNRSGANPRGDWRNRNGGGTSAGDWRQRQGGTTQSNWQGSTNHVSSYSDAYRHYHHDHHNRDWWRSHYPRILLVGGGYYYWDTGYWYPAWGYDASYSSYAYDGPIYGYDGVAPDQVISSVQSALQEEGYYRGAVDGELGPMTRQAIAAWQRDHGLSITTVIDGPTLQSLGL